MQAGDTIAGKYRLTRPLGMGGMASVWCATNVFTEREFAVKFMLPQIARTPEAARRFLLEAKVSGRINHPNIIEVIDVGQAENGALFLVMELLSGVSLDQALRRPRPMRVQHFLGSMRDVAGALAAAHRAGVIHRDLKPSNIFFHNDRDGRVLPKVLDFGVSKIIEEGNSASLTMVGTILGSPLYMSPEQAIGAEGIDGRTDVFAFGSILFEAVCGQRAYAAPNLNALIVAIATTQPRKTSEFAPQLPENLRALIDDCMVTDKHKRLASFEAIAERLDAVLESLTDPELRLPAHRRPDLTPEPPAVTEVDSRAASDRPPPSGRGASVSPLSLPAVQAAIARASTTGPGGLSASPPEAGLVRSRVWAGAAGLAAAALLAGVGAGFARSSAGARAAGMHSPLLAAPREDSLANADAHAPSAAHGPSPDPSPSSARAFSPDPSSSSAPGLAASEQVPVIPVDMLPVAAQKGPQGKGTGRLSIAATPGWCTVLIDGTPRGVTPMRGIELASGNHQVECAPPRATAKTATVNVGEGTEAHYQFTLE